MMNEKPPVSESLRLERLRFDAMTRSFKSYGYAKALSDMAREIGIFFNTHRRKGIEAKELMDMLDRLSKEWNEDK